MPIQSSDDAFFASIGEERKRSKTEVGSRSELFAAFEDMSRPKASHDDMEIDGVGSAQSDKFNRKRDRYDFKDDKS